MRIIVTQLLLASVFFLGLACKTYTEVSDSSPPVQDETNTYSFEHLSFCELVANARNFDGKNVSVQAILITGREYSYLYDPSCTGENMFIWYQIEDDRVRKRLDAFIHPENPEYKEVGLIRVKAIFTGTFETSKNVGFGHEGFFLYKIELLDIQMIETVPQNAPYPWESGLRIVNWL